MKKGVVFGLGLGLGVVLTAGVIYGASLVNNVYLSEFPIKLNGEQYNAQMPVLNYQGRTYLALRELGEVTGNEIDFVDNTVIINNNRNESKEFEFEYVQLKDMEIRKVLNKYEISDIDHNIYTSGCYFYIKTGDEKLELRDALINNKITIQDIYDKMEKDYNAGKCSFDMWEDGGSLIYNYDKFSILKINSMSSLDNSMYIGSKEQVLNIFYNSSHDAFGEIYDIYIKNRNDVDDGIQELRDLEEFKNSSYDEQVEKMGNLLDMYTNSGKISNLLYSKDSQSYTFTYADGDIKGALGGVMLKDFDPYMN